MLSAASPSFGRAESKDPFLHLSPEEAPQFRTSLFSVVNNLTVFALALAPVG